MILFALGVISGILLSILTLIFHFVSKDTITAKIAHLSDERGEAKVINPRNPLDDIVPENYEYQTDRKQNLL